MAVYPRHANDRRIKPDVLLSLATSIFVACRMAADDAHLVAQSLVRSDLRGIHSHGTIRVPDYVKKLTVDGVDPRGRPVVVSAKGAAIVIDGKNSMGQIGATLAMREAIAKARQVGLAYAAVRGSNHCGAMDAYTLMAADAEMIGLAGTNALPTMAPWGGSDKIVGINPLSVALPAKRFPAFCLDFAFGATAHGKIRVYHQKGSAIPEGWAFDADGRPTTDAAAALAGLIQPIGAHKGVGLGMAVGMLSSLLSGAAYGTESGNMIDGARVGTDGHFFIAIDVAAFEEVDRFKDRVDAIIEQVHQSRRASGTDRLLVPGELEAELELAYSRDGVLLSGQTVDDIRATAEKLGVDTTAFLEASGGAIENSRQPG